jgi:Uma2 family endonuclease
MNAPARIALPEPVSAGRVRLRVEDYLLLHEHGSLAGKQTELVDGEVFVLSPEWRPHFRIKSELLYRLRRAVEAAGLPYFVGTEGSIALSDTDMPRPDILLTSEPDGDGPIPRETVPLVVEIASTTVQSDLGSKGLRYAASGIPEYRIVDVDARKVDRMWMPERSRYSRMDEIGFRELLASAALPTLMVATTGF